eukprot:3210459-Alexandrium_andersonii.AAC.1
MSASLVGSEMCIRDRYSVYVSSSTSQLERGREVSGSIKTARSSSRRPVSYTHLTLPTICSV